LSVLEHEVGEQGMVAAAQRDPAHFAELYEANFNRVYAFVARRVTHRHDAEDLTAEVFHEALRNLPRFEWRGLPFVAWLLGIAAHLVADRWREVAARQSVFTGDADDAENTGDPDQPDPTIEERAALYELVDQLPEDQRLVIVRRFVEQKSLREIAAELRRSEGAVKQLQFRALQKLRTRIGSRYAEPIRS
jgi:RNA polymerase sigma-70 factor (ECF subfamily)